MTRNLKRKLTIMNFVCSNIGISFVKFTSKTVLSPRQTSGRLGFQPFETKQSDIVRRFGILGI